MSMTLSLRFCTGLHWLRADLRSSSETLRQGNSSPIIQSISLNYDAYSRFYLLRQALLRVRWSGMATLLVKEAQSMFPSELLFSVIGKSVFGLGGSFGSRGDYRSKLCRLIAMSGCLSEFPVSLRAFSVVCITIVSLKVNTSSYSCAFFSFSILISLSNRTSLYNNSFSRCYLTDLCSYSLYILYFSLATYSYLSSCRGCFGYSPRVSAIVGVISIFFGSFACRTLMTGSGSLPPLPLSDDLSLYTQSCNFLARAKFIYVSYSILLRMAYISFQIGVDLPCRSRFAPSPSSAVPSSISIYLIWPQWKARL